MGGNTGMLASGGSGGGAPAPSMGGGFRDDAPTVPGHMRSGTPGTMSPGSGGQMQPMFGSMAPLAGMFGSNQAASGGSFGAGMGGSGTMPAPSSLITQPQPNPNPAWQSLPTTAPTPAPVETPVQPAAPPPVAGDWAARFFGGGVNASPNNAVSMQRLREMERSSPEGFQRMVNAGHVPPMRGGTR